MSTTAMDRPLSERVQDVLRRAGNPFRNYFARNPDDEVCARYHVAELFAAERDLLLSVVDLYRYDPTTHSEIVPILGNKGAGKTHLLHSIKHGGEGAWQLLVTPGVYQKDSDFLEYLLFQIIDTLLGGGRQKGVRPLDYVGDQLTRRLLSAALKDMSPDQKIDLFPPPGLGRWAKRLGLGGTQATERCDWLAEQLAGYNTFGRAPMPLTNALNESGIGIEQAVALIAAYVEKTEAHNTAGLMRRTIYQGFVRATLLRDESALAGFLTYGFAELDFKVRPTRQDLVLALFKVLMEVFRTLKTPVVVAFDQLEDLLLARRSDDAHKIAEAFFAGIVQVMHQIDGLCFLIFAERGLWNRFVPSLDGYIQDRLNNPIHVPRHGTVKALRLEAPSPELTRRVVEARLRPALDELGMSGELSSIYPFTDDQVVRIARTEPTLRDMLQQFRHLFDHLVYGSESELRPSTAATAPLAPARSEVSNPRFDLPTSSPTMTPTMAGMPMPAAPASMPTPTSYEKSSNYEKSSIHEIPSNYEKSSIHEIPSMPSASNVPVPPEMNLPSASADWVAPSMPEVAAPASLPAEPTELPPTIAAITDAASSEMEADRPPVDEFADGEPTAPANRIAEMLPPPVELPSVKSVMLVESPTPETPAILPMPHIASTPARSSQLTQEMLVEMWEQEQRAAYRKLEPEGALPGATRELQAGLGAFLQLCHEHGVKLGPWRLQHVVSEYTFGEHPTYGAITLAHWACKDGQPWKVGIGLFLAKGAGKPKDLEVKLSSMSVNPTVVDHLILLRPEDDLSLTGKSKTLWQDSERRGQHARLEPVSLEGFAMLYSFPRWLASVTDALPDGQPLPNLGDLIQEHCEKLLEQVCMPIQ